MKDSRDVYEKKVVGQVGRDGMKGWRRINNSNFYKDCRKVRILMMVEVSFRHVNYLGAKRARIKSIAQMVHRC
jgi:hypothetical protein